MFVWVPGSSLISSWCTGGGIEPPRLAAAEPKDGGEHSTLHDCAGFGRIRESIGRGMKRNPRPCCHVLLPHESSIRWSSTHERADGRVRRRSLRRCYQTRQGVGGPPAGPPFASPPGWYGFRVKRNRRGLLLARTSSMRVSRAFFARRATRRARSVVELAECVRQNSMCAVNKNKKSPSTTNNAAGGIAMTPALCRSCLRHANDPPGEQAWVSH